MLILVFFSVAYGKINISTQSLEADVVEKNKVNEDWESFPGYSSSEIDLSNFERFWVWSDKKDIEVIVTLTHKINGLFKATLHYDDPVYE